MLISRHLQGLGTASEEGGALGIVSVVRAGPV